MLTIHTFVLNITIEIKKYKGALKVTMTKGKPPLLIGVKNLASV